MTRPDVNAKAQQIQDEIDAYLETEVRPYLRSLLDKARRRMHRHKIGFVDGMGTTFFTVNGKTGSRLDTAIGFALYSGKQRFQRIADRFPELVEFLTIVCEVSDTFNHDIGDL